MLLRLKETDNKTNFENNMKVDNERRRGVSYLKRVADVNAIYQRDLAPLHLSRLWHQRARHV